MKINKTAALRSYLAFKADSIYYPGVPDCYNRHPGAGWVWSPSQTATKAAPRKYTAKCWHGSAPTPGTQMVEGLASVAAMWLEAWDTIPHDGAIYEIAGKDWQWVDGELCEA